MLFLESFLSSHFEKAQDMKTDGGELRTYKSEDSGKTITVSSNEQKFEGIPYIEYSIAILGN